MFDLQRHQAHLWMHSVDLKIKQMNTSELLIIHQLMKFHHQMHGNLHFPESIFRNVLNLSHERGIKAPERQTSAQPIKTSCVISQRSKNPVSPPPTPRVPLSPLCGDQSLPSAPPRLIISPPSWKHLNTVPPASPGVRRPP